jgi:hypothetical protein
MISSSWLGKVGSVVRWASMCVTVGVRSSQRNILAIFSHYLALPMTDRSILQKKTTSELCFGVNLLHGTCSKRLLTHNVSFFVNVRRIE